MSASLRAVAIGIVVAALYVVTPAWSQDTPVPPPPSPPPGAGQEPGVDAAPCAGRARGEGGRRGAGPRGEGRGARAGGGRRGGGRGGGIARADGAGRRQGGGGRGRGINPCAPPPA